MTNIPAWYFDKDGRAVAVRDAAFWRALPGRRVECLLCYRKCTLDPGISGWCGYRKNVDGKMQLTAHGVISCAVRAMAGYGVDPFLTFKPGQTTLFLGLTHCTAGCTFCMSKEITWRPDALPWLGGKEGNVAHSGGQYAAKSMLHPEGAMAMAHAWGCQRILFGINEPTMSYEYVLDVARLAKQSGLTVALETNGFCGRKVVEKLAPFVDAVDVGIKGSLDPEFYDRWMHSRDAVPTVMESAKAWRENGVFVLIGDLIAPKHMQDANIFEDHAERMYEWIARDLGEHTPVLITPIQVPGPMRPSGRGWLLPTRQGDMGVALYEMRQQRAEQLARRAGLHYAHRKRQDERVRCHACGGVLVSFHERCAEGWRAAGHPNDAVVFPCLMAQHYCPFWSHDQHATDGRCDHCSAAVPIVCLTPDELQSARQTVQREAGHLLTEGIGYEPHSAPVAVSDRPERV